MTEFKKIKIAAFAKELDVKPKEIIALLSQIGIDKPTAGLLDEDEINFILEHYSGLYPVEDINKFIAGEYTLKLSDAEVEALKAEEEVAEREKAEKEAAEKAEMEAREKAEKLKREAEEKLAREKEQKAKAEEEKANAAKSQEKIPDRNRQINDRFAMARPGQPSQQKNDRKKNEKPEKSTAPSAVNRNIPSSTTVPTEVVTAKKDIRIIDTRIVDVDLSKYDEKLYDFVYEGRNDTRHKPPRRPNRKDKKSGKRAEPVRASLPTTIVLPEELAVSELAKEMRVTTADILKKLLMMGYKATANQSIDFDTAAIIADDFGVEAIPKKVVTIEEMLIDETQDNAEDLRPRSPVVVVMGHVDHGKTSLLDAIRHSNVTEGEAGGITQHIGAYSINVNGKDITFLDTPGHEAFTAMRARGAQITDIAILVVAADDGIMPQTVEAINHAKAAGVTIIVAINKMDKPNARPDEIKQELTKYNLVPEEWGGDVICVPVSALTKKGIDDLLESVLLVAEVAELKANPNRKAKGVVIEAKLDRGRGPVATLLVQNGTLKIGDVIIAGSAVGRVRAMTDDKGIAMNEAGPSVPVEILGLSEVPNAGDIFNAVEDEKLARDVAQQRKDKSKENEFNTNNKVSLEDLFSQLNQGQKELNIIVKADVQGSVEAVKASLEKLSCEEVKVKVIHGGVGGINESDVMLADASNAIIVGFNVRPDKGAIDSADRRKVDIRTYRIIYECIEEIEAAIKGMLAPKYREVVLGRAEVRQTIKVPGIGFVAGSYIIDGKVTRSSMIRVLRDNIVIFEDKIASLRRFKDDVKEVAQGFECGIALEKFNDIKLNDVLEAYIMEEIKQ